MLGVIGSDYMIPDANYWMGWNTGKCNANDSLRQISIKLKECEGIREVHAIDGMIMITQYDVEWRKDIFDGFDFYDISQSLEFKNMDTRLVYHIRNMHGVIMFADTANYQNMICIEKNSAESIVNMDIGIGLIRKMRRGEFKMQKLRRCYQR